jgi:tryptophan 2,3-dioxygenase
MHELDDWLADFEKFPYDQVVDEFHSVGKHFVAAEVLRKLDRIRTAVGVLDGFLDTTLDKWDNRYDYQTYLALRLLPLPSLTRDEDVASASVQSDRLVVHLIADALRFELDSSDGTSQLFSVQTPAAEVVARRCRHGVRALQPALGRLGYPGAGDADGLEPDRAARDLCASVERARSQAEKLALKLSNLPVWVSHDEYMFIRILQSFESTFAFLAVCVRAAVKEIGAGDARAAVSRLVLAEARLHESGRLFSLLATMQVEAFRTFRMYTEGASAIQSRNYKAVESLCRVPDQERLDSAAYHSVPDIRARVLAGQATLDEAVREAGTRGLLDDGLRVEVVQAMHSFAETLLRWRQTHYSLAVRMLGDRSGTGYTEGTPYLDQVRKIPVFQYVDTQQGSP